MKARLSSPKGRRGSHGSKWHLCANTSRGGKVVTSSPALCGSQGRGWGGGPTEMREAFLRREPSQGGLVWPPAQHSKAHPTQLAPSAKKKEKETAEE